MVDLRLSLKVLPTVSVVVAGFIAGCGGARSSGPQVGGAASCVGLSSSQQLARAKLVVVATAFADRTAQSGSPHTLASPARMRIDRYIKGHGPKVIEVETALSRHDGRLVANEDGIDPVAGQRWKLFLTGPHSPYQTSICAGSRRVA